VVFGLLLGLLPARLVFDAGICSAQTSTNVPITVNPAISFSPASLIFSTTVGSSSAPQTITATNVGSVGVPIAISLVGTDAGDFSQTTDCPATLSAAASCHITVTFTPTATGARPADVEVTVTSLSYTYLAALAGTGSSAGAALWGLTFDDVTNVSALNNVLANIKLRPTTRIVFDTGQNPTSAYLSPITTFQAHSDIMGELIDSAYMPSYTATTAAAWTVSYYSALHSVVNIWEIGNEVNGNWLSALSDGSDVMPKIEAMYDNITAHAGTITALTFFYEGEPSEPNNCIATSNGGNDMFTWITNRFSLSLPVGSRPAETEKIRTGLNYALISWYPDQCPGENPNWPVVYTRLAATFPNAKVGFGELGTANPQNGSAFEAGEISTYYAMRPNVAGLPGSFIVGIFWWYASEELAPWPGYTTPSFPTGMGPAINAQIN
jgi:hypothetical protein